MDTIYWTLLVFMQHPHREEEESKATGTKAIQTAAYPQEQPVLRAVACIQKKKSKTKSVHVVSDEKEAGPSQQEEETGPEIITQTLSLSELRDMQKDYSLQSGEPLVTWVLLYWAVVARDMKLDGSDTLQLGSMSWNGSIDHRIGKGPETFSLWTQLLSNVRERFPWKDDLLVH